MRLPKRYLKRVAKKRLIEFILIFSVISIVSFGGFMVKKEARSGTGILYQLDDGWYIDSNYHNNHRYYNTYSRIINPLSFSHVLIPENNGSEVHYIHSNNISYYYTYLRISNPDLFPHVLTPENNGSEVHYLLLLEFHSYLAWGPQHHFVYVVTLDLVPVFIIKQSILYFCIAIFSITVFPCLYLNRKKLPITNKLLG